MSKKYVLSEEEIKNFHRDGYIGPIKLYEEDEIEEIWKAVRLQVLDRSQAIYPIAESDQGNTNIANYDRHLDIELLAKHIVNKKITDRVASLIGEDVMCWRSEFFPKYPGDEGTDWHQAATFANASGTPQILWPEENGERFGGTITVWTAFTDSTLENGCLKLMPGTHDAMNYDESKTMKYDESTINTKEKDGKKSGFFGYDYRELQIDPNWKPDESKAFPLVMKKGECVIFWSTLMHASLPHSGKTQDMRLGYVGRYAPTKVKVYPDTELVVEYGGKIPLDKFGCVLVSGEDRYGHNKYVESTTRGYKFNSDRESVEQVEPAALAEA
ncbi:non-heme Fe2+,alpha-ketoglutarate-dependent halogenase [Alteromonadaceae bacterium 2753L.S.0a.02]|nr:non-heme Fe2+,alpha-ketoglutarate-dependent halogenase [Alteromonadaceae bacterium 2753L.S.0a.02]